MSQNLQRGVARGKHKESILPRLEKLITRMENSGEHRRAKSYRWVLYEMMERDNIAPYECVRRMVRFPVDIEEFVVSKDFVGVLDDFHVWPYWQEELKVINPDVVCGEPPIKEMALGGASGTGKSKIAQISVVYDIYVVSCFDSPAALFPNYDGTSPLVVPVMSHKPTITRDIFYTPMRKLLEAMPYVRRHMPWDKNKDAVMHFTEHNIALTPMLAMDTSMSGQSVMAAILDEMSFMEVLQQSKRVPGPRGLGGKFDQAEMVYKEAVSRRNRPPFGGRGPHVGKICVLSNTRYQGDFLDRHLAALERGERDNVYHKRLMRHEVAPEDVAYVIRGDTIRVLVGAPGYSSRVLKPKEKRGKDYPAEAKVIDVPDMYEDEFKYDADNALRMICGITTGVISPFIARREMLAAVFERGKRLKPWVDEDDVDLTERGLPVWIPENMPDDYDVPRFVHVDLSISKDRCGVAVIKVAGMAHVYDPEAPGTPERAPHFVVEVAVSIKPSGTTQIDPGEIRSWLMELGTVHGFQIGGASYDGFQSHESIQRWIKAGVRNAKIVGVDRTTEAYDHLRRAIYQGRVDGIPMDILEDELLELEYHAEKDKVDHPPKGSKDVADAVCASIFNASMTRNVRSRAGYVDPNTGERVRVRKSGHERKGGKKKRRMSLKERNRIKWATGNDPWDL